jgi:hypothetical protein
MLEKVGSNTLGSGKTRRLCAPNHKQLKGQKSIIIKADAATLSTLLAKEICFNQSPAS